MDKARAIPLSSLITEIIQHTNIEDTPEERDRIRKQIERICKKTTFNIENEKITLWQAAKQGKGEKKPRYIFTESQKYTLFSSDEFQKFIHQEGPMDDLSHWEWYQHQKEADRRIETLKTGYSDDDPGNNNQGYYVTRQELQRVKVNMMIEALFSLYFTPFDVEQLESDLNQREVVVSPADETAESIAAENRIFHPEGNYYKRKDK